jgi:hypothetical protein
MYKNIEVLDKKKHEKLKFDNVDALEVAKNIGIVPLGVNEVLDMCSFAPVIISAGEEAEFIAFTGISKEITLYNKNNIYLPKFLHSYPFLNVVVQDEKKNLNTVVAIDNNKEYVGKNKKNNLFTKNSELEKQANEKIRFIRELNTQRDIGKKIIEELKAKDLLLKRDFKVKLKDEEKTILKEFYIINREKLLQLDDATLALWAKKGWMGIIDAHTKSLNNFQNILINQ